MRAGFLTHAGASIYHFRLPIIKVLIAGGDEVPVAVPQDEYTEELKALNLNIVAYEFSRVGLDPLIVFKNFLHLKNVLENLNSDLLQSEARKSSIFGLIAAKYAKIPYKISLVEGLGSFCIGKGFKADLVHFVISTLYKLNFKIAGSFILVNQANVDFMRNLGLKENKICVIKSVGIDLKKFFPMRVEQEAKKAFWQNLKIDEKPIVLVIARALWHKGVKEFYESAEYLKDRANFVLVGGGDDNPSCASLKFLNSGKIFYLGARSDIVELLQNCDIFVLPSYKEGFPASVLEVRACGKVTVVSDCEGCVEAILNTYDGLWARTKNSKDLTEKIQVLLEDESLRINLGKNAAKNALQYNENIIAQRYLKLYDRAIKNI